MSKQVKWEKSSTKRMYEYMCTYWTEHGRVPSARVIAKYMGGWSTSTVFYNMERLKKMRLVENIKIGKSKHVIMLVGALHLPPPETLIYSEDMDKIDEHLAKYTRKIVQAWRSRVNVPNPKDHPVINPTEVKERV